MLSELKELLKELHEEYTEPGERGYEIIINCDRMNGCIIETKLKMSKRYSYEDEDIVTGIYEDALNQHEEQWSKWEYEFIISKYRQHEEYNRRILLHEKLCEYEFYEILNRKSDNISTITYHSTKHSNEIDY